MTPFTVIAPAAAEQLIAEENAALVDIRDPDAYSASHIEGAIHLDNAALAAFIEDTDKDRPLIVYCYHGISSQSAAAYLAERGFHEVYSVEGGYESWRLLK